MSYDHSDAAFDSFIDEALKEFRVSAIDDPDVYDRIVEDFQETRLREHYLANPIEDRITN